MPSFATQTTYSAFPPIGVPGQRANMELGNVISRSVETAAGIPFGAPVGRGVDKHSCVLYVTGGKFLGFAMKTMAPEHRQNGDTVIADGYPRRATANVMERGQMYHLADVAVAVGDAVYWNATTGRYSNSATGNLAIPNAFFDTPATAAGQTIEISLRNRVA